MRRQGGIVVGDDQPYALDPAEDYSITIHAMERGLLHLQIGFRQDLVASEEGFRRWASLFADGLAEIWAGFRDRRRIIGGYSVPLVSSANIPLSRVFGLIAGSGRSGKGPGTERGN